ncbi:unnamed protein product, partial [Cyprideis torosa]
AGVNTHRGAIFNLGLLAAAAGQLRSEARDLEPETMGLRVRQAWGSAILAQVGGNATRTSHGGEVARRYGAGGARAEAASGFATVMEISLPAFNEVMAELGDERRALMQALFALIGHLEDTNLLYRGGLAGLRFAQSEASGFLRAGGVYQADWLERAQAIHQRFVQANLSPGGSADLLATTLFVAKVRHVVA